MVQLLLFTDKLNLVISRWSAASAGGTVLLHSIFVMPLVVWHRRHEVSSHSMQCDQKGPNAISRSLSPGSHRLQEVVFVVADEQFSLYEFL